MPFEGLPAFKVVAGIERGPAILRRKAVTAIVSAGALKIAKRRTSVWQMLQIHPR
jgi:hypothetical protein